MTTYSVPCAFCQNETLQEHPEPLADIGTLKAFCSPACSIEFGRALLVDTGGIVCEMSCGCLVSVLCVEGNGSTMDWGVCELGTSTDLESRVRHKTEIHHEAVELVRRRN